MVKVKVCSNPYQKEILFYKWDDGKNNWISIEYSDNPNSQLISEKITHSFLTFKAGEIIQILLDEYDDGGDFTIEFEGAENEFQELNYLVEKIKLESNKNISIIKSDLYLENAEKVLPKVISIFERMTSIIPESVRNDEDIQKFKEASGDVIPLVIVGNYSAGKSTFINSLIGYDILPNSDSPVTAKIIKISNANQSQVTISFDINSIPVVISVYGNNYEIQSDLEGVEALFSSVAQDISNSHNVTLEMVVNLFLTKINDLDAKDNVGVVSDIITVSTPFNKGILTESGHQFVLFDTPGSNSSSNKNHFEVLKSAMRNMSNGLVLFVTEYTSLDTVDNETLFDELKSIEEIDSRFTMIIVNKADGADFSDFNVKQLLNQAVPKNIFSEGIFFVSSIMGLGSKNSGQFIDKNYDRVFKRSFDEFSNSEAEYYQQVYQYNVVPSQLKQRMLDQTMQHTNPVYVNSGLYSIEKEILTFSEYYSAYNKCQQSKLYLEKIIEKTEQTVTVLKSKLSQDVEMLYKEFEKHKQHLIGHLDVKNANQIRDYNQLFERKIFSEKQALIQKMTLEKLQSVCEQFYEIAKVEFQLEKYKQERKDSQKVIKKNLFDNFENVKNTLDFSHVKQLGKQVTDDFFNIVDDKNEYAYQKNGAFNSVSEKVIEYTVKKFEDVLQITKDKIYKFSANYWQGCAIELKEELSKIVGASDILSPEKQSDIQQLILDYRIVMLKENQEQFFDRADLTEGFKIGKVHLLGNDNRLDLNKVVKKYNKLMSERIEESSEDLKQRHQHDFEQWAESLLSLIKENIVDFNPDLKETNRSIIQKEEEIGDYETKLAQLVASTNEIKHLLSFKTSQ